MDLRMADKKAGGLLGPAKMRQFADAGLFAVSAEDLNRLAIDIRAVLDTNPMPRTVAGQASLDRLREQFGSAQRLVWGRIEGDMMALRALPTPPPRNHDGGIAP